MGELVNALANMAADRLGAIVDSATSGTSDSPAFNPEYADLVASAEAAPSPDTQVISPDLAQGLGQRAIERVKALLPSINPGSI